MLALPGILSIGNLITPPPPTVALVNLPLVTDANDISGNNFDATISGGSFTGGRLVINGGSVSLPYPNQSVKSMKNFTLLMRLNVNRISTTDYAFVVTVNNITGGTTVRVSIGYFVNSSTWYYEMASEGGSSFDRVYMGSNFGMTFNFDTHTIRYYNNGVFIREDVTTNPMTHEPVLDIITRVGSGWDGYMNDYKVFPSVLTDAEILAQYA